MKLTQAWASTDPQAQVCLVMKPVHDVAAWEQHDGREGAMRTDDRLEFEWLFRAAYPRIKRTVALVLRDHEAAEASLRRPFLSCISTGSRCRGSSNRTPGYAGLRSGWRLDRSRGSRAC